MQRLWAGLCSVGEVMGTAGALQNISYGFKWEFEAEGRWCLGCHYREGLAAAGTKVLGSQSY